MVRVSRILRDYREAGSVNALLALWGFVDDHTFLTKAGALGVAFQLRGADYECLDHPQRRLVAHRFERSLRQLDESFRTYECLIKRPTAAIAAVRHWQPIVDQALASRAAHFGGKADGLFEFELYLVLLSEGLTRQPNLMGRILRLAGHPKAAIQ